MAERRMMSKKIIHSDAFLDLPSTTQNLYFHLLLEADDEGFVNNPKRIQKTIGASDGDAQLLVDKKFIILFESGIVVIKHWRIHNYIQNDRFKSTSYIQERSMLSVEENNGYKLYPKCTPSIGEYSIDKVSIIKDTMSPKGSLHFSVDVISYLNDNAKTNFRNGIKKTIGLIDARKKEGFTLDDFKKVIDNKVTEWKNNSDMCKYLRPETLFGNKFESYLNQKVSAQTRKAQTLAESNREAMDEYERIANSQKFIEGELCD